MIYNGKTCMSRFMLQSFPSQVSLLTNDSDGLPLFFLGGVAIFYYTPLQTKLRGYKVILMSVRPSVRSFVRPSLPTSNPYSSKSAEQNFMKLSGIVHYMIPYCTFYF